MQAQPFDNRKDMKNHPEISQLLRIIMDADPFVVAEGSGDEGPYVIVGGFGDQFQFTKTADGYTLKKTK